MMPDREAIPGAIVVLQGRPHFIVKASASGVTAEPLASDRGAKLVRYRGRGVAVSAPVARGLAAVSRDASILDGMVVVERDDVDRALAPTRQPCERHEYRTYAGELVNRLVASWLRGHGISVVHQDEWRLVLGADPAQLVRQEAVDELWEELKSVVMASKGLFARSPHSRYIGQQLAELEVRSLVPLAVVASAIDDLLAEARDRAIQGPHAPKA